MHLFLFTNTAQRELYAENTQQQLTLLALLPCSILRILYMYTLRVQSNTLYIVYTLRFNQKLYI